MERIGDWKKWRARRQIYLGRERNPAAAAERAKEDPAQRAVALCVLCVVLALLVPFEALEDVIGGQVFWNETRPEEAGRYVLVGETDGEILPATFSARTKVHEYGGRCFAGQTQQI